MKRREFSAVLDITWFCIVYCQLFEAMNQLRRQMDQQKSEFDEERKRLRAKMFVSFSRVDLFG